MLKFLLMLVVAAGLSSPAIVFLTSPKPIKRQWEDVCLGYQVVRDFVLGKGSLP